MRRWIGAALTALACCKSSPPATSGGGGATTTSTAAITTTTAPDAGPLTCPGSAGTMPTGVCDPLQQDCPPGKTCRPNGATNATTCVPAYGLKTASEACSAHDECDAGLFCVFGKCAPVCCPDTNEPCGSGICDATQTYGPYRLTFCHFSPRCSVLTEDACEPGTGCHVEDAKQGLATCSTPAATAVGDQEACKYINDCPDMEQCWGPPGGQALCHFLCWTDAANDALAGLGGCPAGQTCRLKSGSASVSYGVPKLGLCFADAAPDGGAPDGGAPDGGAPDGGGAGGAPVDAGSGGAPVDGGIADGGIADGGIADAGGD
jgi:hypothetical protein